MSFKFYCPYCGQKIESEDRWDGLHTLCPSCGKNITIKNDTGDEEISPGSPLVYNNTINSTEEHQDNCTENKNDNAIEQLKSDEIVKENKDNELINQASELKKDETVKELNKQSEKLIHRVSDLDNDVKELKTQVEKLIHRVSKLNNEEKAKEFKKQGKSLLKSSWKILKFLKETLDALAVKVGQTINKKFQKNIKHISSGYIVLVSSIALLTGAIIFVYYCVCGRIFRGFKVSSEPVKTAQIKSADRSESIKAQERVAEKLVQCYDYQNGLAVYSRLAAQKNAWAELQIAKMYMAQLANTPYDINEIVYHLRRSADLGNNFSKVLLGSFYIKGRGLNQDKTKGAEYIKSGLSGLEKQIQFGDAEAMYFLGMYYHINTENDNGKKEFLKWLKKSAELGYAEAQMMLGSFYYSGQGLAKDKAEGLKWMIKAGEQDYILAQVWLAQTYYDGYEFDNAFEWYYRASKNGHITSMKILGVFYNEGEIVEQDFHKACKYYKKSAECGDAEAQYEYAKCLEKGRGVKENFNLAVYWYRKAAQAGNGDARKILKNRGIYW